jgi:hypothetical protein
MRVWGLMGYVVDFDGFGVREMELEVVYIIELWEMGQVRAGFDDEFLDRSLVW